MIISKKPFRIQAWLVATARRETWRVILGNKLTRSISSSEDSEVDDVDIPDNTPLPDEELIGLARGFFSAGAPSLLVTLRTVDDEQTARLMQKFHTGLIAGRGPAGALREAQVDLIREQCHPFFWSPFILVGRW